MSGECWVESRLKGILDRIEVVRKNLYPVGWDTDPLYEIERSRLMAISAKIGGSWKSVEEAFVKIGGVWKPVDGVWVKIDGVWRQA